jgi:hypothetical protein
MRVLTGSSDIGTIRAPTPRRAQSSAVTSDRLAEAQRAVDVGGQVAVAQAEPGVLAVGGKALQAAEGVAGVPPATRCDHPGERVGADVEIGADAQAVEVGVVAGVHDRHEVGLSLNLRQPVQHLGAAGAPRQGEDHER